MSKEELERLEREKYVVERKLTAAKHKEKRLQSELKRLTRSERTHRLCTRAGMLETFLKEPTTLTDDDVMELLTFIFHSEAVQDESASRAFIDMMWAEAMFIYQNFPVKLTLSKDMDKELKELQKQFMPEDTKAGLIQSFLDNYKGTQVCSKLIYAEALNHPFDEPKQWEIREINEIMNNCIEGWRPFSNPRSFAKYGRQRGWERIPPPDNEPSATGSNLTDGFREISEEEASQMELPF